MAKMIVSYEELSNRLRGLIEDRQWFKEFIGDWVNKRDIKISYRKNDVIFEVKKESGVK